MVRHTNKLAYKLYNASGWLKNGSMEKLRGLRTQTLYLPCLRFKSAKQSLESVEATDRVWDNARMKGL